VLSRLSLASLAIVSVVCVGCDKSFPRKVESGFDMAKDSMSFTNFASGYEASAMDAAGMQRMFGTAVCRTQTSPCELTLAATAFMNKANKAMLGGRCEGFAVLSSMLQARKLVSTAFGGETARDLTLAGNTPLQRELAYWFATQLHPAVVEKTKGYSAKNVMSVLAEALAKDATERVRIGIVKKTGDRVTGGHALTPIAYFPESDGVYLLRVYDNNLPDTVRTMKIDTNKNRWEYEASENPQKKPSLYFGDDTNKNLLYLAPIFTRTGELSCHFCTGGGAQVTTSGGAQVLVNGTGVAGGEPTTSGGGQVSPMFSATNDEEGTSYNIFVKDAATYKMTLVDGDDGTSSDGSVARVEISGATFNASLSGLHVQGDNAWDVSGNGRKQTFINDSHNPVVVSQEVQLGGKTLAVSATIQGSSDSVATEIKDDGKIQIDTKGTVGTMVAVHISVTNSAGVTTQGTLTYTAQGDSTLSTDSAVLEMTGTASGTLDNNGMMQVLGDACSDGQRNGTESDIDCGGTCQTKCATGLSCNAGADCGSTFCSATAKLCVDDHCSDQARSADESDVDCGGSCAAKCASGKACAGSLDCASGFVCAGLVCTPSFVLGASVTGLGAGAAVTLTNSTNGDVLTISANDTQAFPTRIVGPYTVSITQQPATGQCTLMNGSGTAAANVTLTVTCAQTFGVAGSVAGLGVGNSLTILNNGADAQTLTANGAFVFSARVTGAYAVTVQTQPSMQLCTIASGSGTATVDVSDVAITCGPAGFPVGGTVSGLGPGLTVVLQNNGGNDLSLSTNGAFTFTVNATGYAVTVLTQPLNGSCAVSNGTGTASAAVSSVLVTCVGSGVLDTTFAVGGFLSDARTGRNEWFRGVMNPDNSSVWVGRDSTAAVSNQDMVISKVTPSGALDPSFGTGGNLILTRGVDSEQARAVHRLANGTYLFAGEAQGASSKDFTVGRVTAAGALDATFGTAGLVQLDSGGNAIDILADMVVRPNGTMILVGTTGTGTNANVTVMGLTAAGALDGAFGTGGLISYGTAGVADIATAVALSPLGDIIVVGSSGNDSLILRFTGSGAPMVPFGSNGVLIADLGAGQVDGLNAIQMEGEGVVVGGYASNGVDNDMLVASYTALGSPNSSFGSAGVVKFNRGGTDVVRRIVPGPMGGFYIAGATDSKMSVALLQNNGTPRVSFGVLGFYEAQLAATSATGADILFDGVGRLLVGGSITDSVNPDFGVARLLP